MFQKEEGLVKELQEMDVEKRSQICYKVICIISDLKACSRFMLKIRKQLTAYNKMSYRVGNSNQFQLVADQISSLLDCDKVHLSHPGRGIHDGR